MTNAENETKTIKTTYLTSNYFVRNGNSLKPFTLTYGNENSSILMPTGKAIYANVLGNNVPLSGGSGGGGLPDYTKGQSINFTISGSKSFTAPNDGIIYINGTTSGSASCTLYLNGKQINATTGFSSSSTTFGDEFSADIVTNYYFYIVKKGDKLTASLGEWYSFRGRASGVFYPFK